MNYISKIYGLTLTSGRENDGQEIFALYRADSTTWLTLGKMRVQTYPHKVPNVVLVPVNGARVDRANIENSVNEIYSPIGVDFTFSVDDNFENSAWDLNGNGYLDVAGSGLLSSYTAEMKALNAAYEESKGGQLAEKTVYLFVLPAAPTDRDGLGIAGDMPRNRQFGYLFADGTNMGYNHIYQAAVKPPSHPHLFQKLHTHAQDHAPDSTDNKLAMYLRNNPSSYP